MNITTTASKAALQTGMGFFELFLGADKFAEVRNGEAVQITCVDGEVEGTVSGVQIGPMGQFLSVGMPHLSNLGRAHDVRSVIDSLEARYPAKGNPKALDPRTVYTSVHVAVPFVSPVTPSFGITA